jgi:putative membrane protein
MPPLPVARLTVAALLVFSASCSLFRRGSSAPAAPAAPAAVRIVGPTDGEITAILLAANNTDISYAKLAPSRAQSQAVKDFAALMIKDHTGVNTLVNDLITVEDITPVESKMSLDLRDESAMKRDLMRELSGRAFDTTYMSNEISYHTRLLASIDGTLLPAARDAQLKQLISRIRPAVAAHLTHAQQVRAALPR